MSFRCFDYPEAIEINKKRIEFIESLGIDWKGKTVLETGMGARGDFSRYLTDKGATVYAFDARNNNVEEFKRRHPDITHVYTIDFDQPDCLDVIGIEKFDYVLCVGTLYHLKNPVVALEQMAKYSDNLILTTQVGTAPGWNWTKENDSNNQCFNECGCRPHPTTLKDELSRLYTNVDTTRKVNHHDFQQQLRAAFVCSK